ncbi:MAG: pyridoxamine 5'-phosphate oxidase family protein [Rubrivivax sp.]|nr:pyridoxamine 5'-phosphate oxidase family protein [Rubrivivax sp.]
MPPARLTTLGAIEAATWDELQRAGRDKHHPWRVAVLATLALAPVGEAAATEVAAGDAPPGEEPFPTHGVDARCVLLREVDREHRTIVFFADARSPKMRQIEADARGTLVVWSNELSWQVRLSVRLEVALSGLAVSSRWARLKMTPAAQDYLSPLPPGSPLDDPHPAPERATREHFGVVSAQVRRMDWTELHADGHRRAVFDAAGARWVVP